MGQAKLRGTKEERITQAEERIANERIAKERAESLASTLHRKSTTRARIGLLGLLLSFSQSPDVEKDRSR